MKKIQASLTILVLCTAVSCSKENVYSKASIITDQTSEGYNRNSDKTLAGNKVRIGSQIWMTKNLDVVRYRNGDKIPEVKRTANWAALTTGAWCWYNNDSINGAVYGKLYNWYAVNDPRGLAPEGWHVPSDAEWTTLSDFLGGASVAGGKMKEVGISHWAAPNNYATNSSGFTALPGGARDYAGIFFSYIVLGTWWSSSINSSGNAFYRNINYGNGGLYGDPYPKVYGFSVRCIKD